jgi:predicted glycosyltransferase
VAPDEKICVVTVGGTSVGAALLHKVIGSYPLARRLVPELRMIVVTGPRIDPAALAAPAGVTGVIRRDTRRSASV